jgi:predicted site-specific integrase-resolvase
MNLDRFLTYAEAAEILDLAPDTIRQYCQRGLLDREYPMNQRAPFVTRDSVARYQRERRAYERQSHDPR